MEEVMVSPIINEVLELHRSSIRKNIEVHLDIASEVDAVLADQTMINQALINLCANAADSMEDKGGVLKVSLENVEINEDRAAWYYDLSPGKYVRLMVSDTGCGIEPEFMDRIFDPYFTTKKVGEGSGLGLSVVYGIVKSHGGHISADSQPGKGTTFQVLLPSINAADMEPA